MSITGFKLSSGEDVIAEATITEDSQVRLEIPVQITLVPPQIQGGPPSLGFAPFPQYAVQGSTLLLEPLHIVYSYSPDEGIANEYTNMVNRHKATSSIIAS